MFYVFVFLQKKGKWKEYFPDRYNLSLFREFSRGKKKKERVFSCFFDGFPEKKKKAAQSGVFEAPERAA